MTHKGSKEKYVKEKLNNLIRDILMDETGCVAIEVARKELNKNT